MRRTQADGTADGSTVTRVLLVEDDPDDQALVQLAFRDPAPLPGPVELEVVGDAEAALAAVERVTFAVILSDFSLPGADGLTLLRTLREQEDSTPVVMITAAGDESLAVAALHAGADEYVAKAFGFHRELPVIVDRVLGRRARALDAERAREALARHARHLERQLEEQAAALRRALQESEALGHLGRVLAAARELRPVLDLVTQATAQLVRAQASAIIIRAGADVVLASACGALQQSPGLKSKDVAGIIGAGWREVGVASLRDGDLETGLLWVGRSRAQGFASRELEVLQAVADLTALTIAKVRAQERLRRHAERSPGAGDPPAQPPEAAAPGAPRPASPPPPRRSAPEPVDPASLVVPPFPAALARLLALAGDDDASPDDVEEAVGLDPALATRVIQLASAPALGRAAPASSLREALIVIGLRGIRNLACVQFSRGLVVRWGVLDQLLWEQSLGAATGAQLLLEARERRLADDAYLCGLLHNVGAVALNNAYPDRYERAVQRAIGDARPLADTEREEFGCDAAAVTARLVEGRTLPADVTRILTGGDGPVQVALGWACAEAFAVNPVWRRLLHGADEPSWIAASRAAAESALGLDPTALRQVRAAMAARLQVVRGLVA